MKDLENAAIVYANKYPEINGAGLAYLDGAKSEAAKEYHTKGMYSEEEVKSLLNKAFSDIGYTIRIDSYPDGTLQQAFGLDKWFEKNNK